MAKYKSMEQMMKECQLLKEEYNLGHIHTRYFKRRTNALKKRMKKLGVANREDAV